jgi:hypothetical protein
MKKRELLGYVGVDSGQLLITDPCYISDFKNNEYAAPHETKQGKTEYSYAGACHATLGEKQGGSLFNDIGAELGVAFSSGYGDGVYPVYVEYNDDPKDKRVKRIIIELIQ